MATIVGFGGRPRDDFPPRGEDIVLDKKGGQHRRAERYGATVPPAQRKAVGWYITTDFFHNGGKIYDGWGPFPTSEMAMRVRALLEKDKGRADLFIDNWPVVKP